jgi:methionyl-tRNA synthetase
VAKYQSTVPTSGDPPGPLKLAEDDQDYAFLSEVNKLLQTYNTLMDSVRLREGLQTVMQLSARGNLYLQGAGLNNALLASDPKRCAQVISRAINLIWILSAMVGPFMPSTEESILRQINCAARTVPSVAEDGSAFSIDILEGHVIGETEYLFTKIEDSKAELWRGMYGSAANTATTEAKGKENAKAKKSKKAAEGDAAGGAGGSSAGGIIGTVKEKVKKVKVPKAKKEKGAAPQKEGAEEVNTGAGAGALDSAEAKKEEAEVKKDTMESTSQIPVPSAGTGSAAA